MSRIIKQSSNDNSTLDLPALNESVESNIAQLDARSIITLQTASFRQIAKPTLFHSKSRKDQEVLQASS